jgi:DNA-binding NtrC family response regulator
MTIRVFCRWIGAHALHGFAKAAEMPETTVLMSPRPTKVLAICPKDHDHLLLRMAAFHDGWDLSLTRSFPDAASLLRRGEFSIVLYDADLPSPDWRHAVTHLAAPGYGRIVILMSSKPGDETWHRAIELGAFDVLEKPVLGTELLSLVSDARRILESGVARAR